MAEMVPGGTPGMPAPAPAAPAAPSPMMGGATGPATVGSSNDGMRMRGMTKVNAALKVLELALPDLGVSSKEGLAVSKALAALGGSFAGASAPLMQQEVKMMGDSVSPVTQPTPQQTSAFQELIRQRVGGLLGSPPGPAASPVPDPTAAPPPTMGAG